MCELFFYIKIAEKLKYKKKSEGKQLNDWMILHWFCSFANGIRALDRTLYIVLVFNYRLPAGYWFNRVQPYTFNWNTFIFDFGWFTRFSHLYNGNKHRMLWEQNLSLKLSDENLSLTESRTVHNHSSITMYISHIDKVKFSFGDLPVLIGNFVVNP